MTERIIIAGSGGQGIMLLGKILSHAAMLENKFITWLPAYGAEVRGGTAHCMVVISDEEIGSPYVDKAETLIVMNQPSLLKFRNRLDDNGLLILNSSMVKNGINMKALSYPFTDIALKLGNVKVANMVALGLYLSVKKLIKVGNVVNAMKMMAPPGKKDILRVNQEALEKGIKLKNG